MTTSSAIKMRVIYETPNFYRTEGKLPNGHMWVLYIPKHVPRDDEMQIYTGRYAPVDPPHDPVNGCNCRGAHYHPPRTYRPRAKTTRAKRKK